MVTISTYPNGGRVAQRKPQRRIMAKLFDNAGIVLLKMSLLLLVLNPAIIFHIENMNQINKFTILASGILFLATRKIYPTRVVIIILIIFCTLFAAIGSDNQSFSEDRYFRSLISFVGPWILFTFRPTVSDAKNIVSFVMKLPIIAVIWGIILQTFGIYTIWSGLDGGFLRLQGSLIPAGMTAVAMVGTFAAMLAYAHKHRHSAVILPVNIGILILSGGRMGIAATAVLVAATVATRIKLSFRSGLFISLAIMFLSVFIIVFGGSTIDRFMDNSLSGRDYLWEYLEYVKANFYYAGVGLGHQPSFVPPWLEIIVGTTAAHDEYLRLQLELGVFASSACLLLMLTLLFVAWNAAKIRNDLLMPCSVAVFAIYSTTDNTFSSITAILILILPYFVCAAEKSIMLSSSSQNKPATIKDKLYAV